MHYVVDSKKTDNFRKACLEFIDLLILCVKMITKNKCYEVLKYWKHMTQ